MFILPNQEDFVEVYSRAVSFITIKEKGMNNQYQCRIQCWTPWFNPKEETSIALAWISFSSLSTQMFAREALFSLASAVGTPLQVDKVTTGKSRPSVARVKVEVNLLSSLSDRVRIFSKDEKNGVVKEVLQKIVYDKLPSYYTTCKHQGHMEEECRLPMEVKGGLIDETKINGAKFEGELRSILDEKKKVLSLQQTGKESWLLNQGNMKPKRNTLDLDKQIEQTGMLKQCCHDEYTTQQALVTHEKEFIVTKKIYSKEINPNTPTMFILDQEVATNNLNESKEKRRGSALRWADLVEEQNHTPSRSKLSPQALEFDPTSKTNLYMAVIGTSSNLSATKVSVADRDILYGLDSDMSDGDDEDHGDDEEEMLDICFDKVAKEGDL
ncbi:hypothetical protein H5410_052018 [Solanum commersonii]|uniref:DUF4283 domain-containing protein n=1 Tax=Solanum commersonii TaxID=4109 RepID=A0A9J5X134_SOLCO|nr:hypothetical protein H5410_052018 [Solanum commersonii]